MEEEQVICKLKHYKVTNVIGEGTFSDVYKATNEKTNSVVALKCFKLGVHMMRLYRSAAKELAFLRILKNHPNIVQVEDFDLNKDFRSVFIVTEFAEYGSLMDYLVGKVPCEEDVVQCVMRQLISALDFMHHLGVIHGDVKMHNILVTKIENEGKPVIKLADFGLTILKLKDRNLLYQVGSLIYMAPEVLLKQKIDHRSDLWSAGVVMCYMMYGYILYSHSETDRVKHVDYIKRKVMPVFDESRFSEICIHFLKGLLTFEKERRLSGVFLRRHTFLLLEPPSARGADFIESMTENMQGAKWFAGKGRHGDALVLSTQANLELKISYNLNPEWNSHEYVYYKCKALTWFGVCQEKRLVLSSISEPGSLRGAAISNQELRKHLTGTSTLLKAFDTGCQGSMYLREGHRDRAVSLFYKALQELLPILFAEPASNRKRMLGRKMLRWIGLMERRIIGPKRGGSRGGVSLFYYAFGPVRGVKKNKAVEAIMAQGKARASKSK